MDVPTETYTLRKNILQQVIAALTVSALSLMTGFIAAYTAPIHESLEKDLNLTPEEYSWIGGLMPFAGLIGGLFAGQLIEYVGRKWTLRVAGALFVISYIITACATNVYIMYVSRSIAGLGVGIASLTMPVYLGETIRPEVRGTLGLLPTAFGNSGILVAYIVGGYVTWYQLAWLGIVLPVPSLILMFFIPETPRWYISKGKDEKAKKSLQWLRGKVDITTEFDELVQSHLERENLSSKSKLSEFFTKYNMKPVAISCSLMFFQQLSGINVVIFYTTSIFKMAGSSIPEHISTIIVGFVNFISSFIAAAVIDKIGRKVLLYTSAVAMIITQTALGTYFYFSEHGFDVSSVGWLPLMSSVLYVLGFSFGFGPVPWLMLGEILPAKIKGTAASLATSCNWGFTFVVTKVYADLLKVFGPHGTFWIFAAFCLASLFFVIFFVPETRGQSIEDIERKFKKTTPAAVS